MGEGSYITLFSPSDVTEIHRIKYGGGGIIKSCFHRVTSLHFRELAAENMHTCFPILDF